MTVNDLDKFLDDMPKRGVPSCAFCVTVNGKSVYRRLVNMPDANRNINHVCSISKILTCVAAMRLFEEGKIALDDPVYKYLPAYKNLTVKQPNGEVKPQERVMTVLNLFTMTGGLSSNRKSDATLRVTKDKKASTLDIVNSFAEMPLDFEPGERFQYSLCHDVLVAVCEAASGMLFHDYVKKYILDPLDMKDTGYHLTEDLMPRLEKQYEFKYGESKEIEPMNPFILSDNYDSGGAGVYSTADDQIKLLTALACDGKAPNGYQLLKPETVLMLEKDRLTDEQRKPFVVDHYFGYSWGLCCRVHINPTVSFSPSSVGEFGWDGATGSYALVDRKKRVAIYYSTHIYGCRYGFCEIHPRLRDMAYELFVDKN